MKKNVLNKCLALSLAALVTLTSVPMNVFATGMDDGIEISKETESDSSKNSQSDDIQIVSDDSKKTAKTDESEDDIVIENKDDESDISTDSADDSDITIVQGADGKDHVASSDAKAEAAKQDFSSKELIVKVDNANVVKDADVSGNYEDVYLMKYDTEAEAKEAFMYYYDNISKDDEFVAANTVFGVATNDDDVKIASDEDATVEDIDYDKDTTSLDELADAVKADDEQAGVASLLTIGYMDTVALIDTGATGVDEMVSMLGEDTSDENGHGTEMVKYMREVNKNVHVLSIKALDGNGHGDAASIYAAIEYAVSKNVKVINLSLYGYNTKDNAAIVAAIKDATDAGITVVGAAGNGGNDVKNYLPGNIEDIIVVGACDEDGKRIATSNYGDTVDYNVVASSTSEAAAKMSSFVALNDVSGIDDVLNQGMIYETDYDGEDITIDESGEATVDGSTTDDFTTALTLHNNGVGSISGFHYTIVAKKLTINNATITSGSDNYEFAVKDNMSSNVKYRAGLYSKKTKLSDLNHSWKNVTGNITIKFSGAVKSSQGYRDLEVTISNIQAKYHKHLVERNSKDQGVMVLGAPVGADKNRRDDALIFRTPGCDGPNWGYSIRYDIKYSVVGAASSEKLALYFDDFDTRGCNGTKRVFANESSNPYDDAVEGITVSSGVSDVWVASNHVLNITGNNTKFYATTKTGEDSDIVASRAAVSLLGNATGIGFKWSGTNCGTGIGGFGSVIPSYTVNLYAKYQNADGSWPSSYGSTPVKTSGSIYSGQSVNISWTDTAAGFGNISGGTGTGLTYSGRTASINIGSLTGNVNCYVDIPRSPVTGKTYVRYQHADGTWDTSWTQVNSASVNIGGTYSYTYTKPNDAAWGTPTSSSTGVTCNANGATVSAKLTSDANFYISVPRVQRTYSFDYNIPKAVTDSGYNETSLRNKGYLTGTQSAFTHYYGANADSVASVSLKGYTFKGWNTSADGTGSWYTDTDGQNPGSSHKVMTSNKTFYAIWTGRPDEKPKVTVKVRYQNADGSWGEYSTLVNGELQNMYSNYSKTYTVPEDQRKAFASRIDVERENPNSGNTCSMTDNDSTTAIVGITEIIRDETFLISVYRKPYNIKTEVRYEQLAPMTSNQVDYSGQKGNWSAYTNLDTKSVLYEAMYSYLYKQIDGAQWGTSKCTTTGQTGKSFTISEIVKGDATYQIDVPRARYTVVYDPNGSQDLTWQEGEKKQNVVEGTMANSQYIYDLSGKLRPNAYTRAGYEFVGWNTKADGTGTAYKDNYTGVLKWANDGESVTLYAQWKKKLGTETLTVVSEETGKPVANVTVQLYKKVNGKDVAVGDTMTTNAAGKVVVNELHWFDYTWKCVSVPAGYEKFKDINYGINYDHLVNEDTVILSMKHVKLTIDSRITEVIKGEHAPSFVYHVEGIDAAGVKHSYNIMVGVDGNTLNGSNTTKDMFAGTYTITQVPNERYIPDKAENVSNCTVSGINATADLLNNTEAEAEFPYYIYNYGWFTSMHSAVNKLTK